MTSLQPAETENQASNSEDDSDSGGDLGSGAAEKTGAGGERGSAQKARKEEKCTESKKRIREGEKRSDRERNQKIAASYRSTCTAAEWDALIATHVFSSMQFYS